MTITLAKGLAVLALIIALGSFVFEKGPLVVIALVVLAIAVIVDN